LDKGIIKNKVLNIKGRVNGGPAFTLKITYRAENLQR